MTVNYRSLLQVSRKVQQHVEQHPPKDKANLRRMRNLIAEIDTHLTMTEYPQACLVFGFLLAQFAFCYDDASQLDQWYNEVWAS